MALTFDTHEAIRKLRGKGHSERPGRGRSSSSFADATSELLTTEHFHAGMEKLEARMDARFEAFRADLYRVSLIQGGVIIVAVVALLKLL